MTAFTIEVDDRAVRQVLDRLTRSAADPKPALSAIGEKLYAMTRRSFETSTDPWGRAWKPTKKGNKPLIGAGKFLSGPSLHYNVAGNTLTLGSSAVYAAIHQFGGQTKPHAILPVKKQALAFGGKVVKKVNHPGSKIPARPFLPVTQSGELAPAAQQVVTEVIAEYLEMMK